MAKTYDSLIRVSKMGAREESAESTMTITDQRDANLYAIRAKDGKVGRELKALDQSGHTVTESPAWREALARCQSGESNGIVVAYGDRLARNWRKLGRFYDELEEAGAEVIIAGMPNVDYRTADGRTQTGMMAVMADMQWQAAKGRGDRIADLTLARGVANRPPYGYMRNGTFVDGQLVSKIDSTLDGKGLVPDPARAQWVRLIFRLRADGWPWASISDELAGRGVVPPGKGGDRWATSTLRNTIANRTYLGFVILGKREPVLAHEPLVTDALWHAAQSERCKTTRTGLLVGGLAMGVVTCASCGGVMSAGHDGNRGVVYKCRVASSEGRCPRPMYVKRDAVDQWLDAWVVEGIEGTEPFDVFVTARELSTARAASEKATDNRKRIVKTAALWEPEDAQAAYEAARTAELLAIAHYEEQLTLSQDVASLPESANAWHALDLDARRRVVRLLVARIDVAPPANRSRLTPIVNRLTLVQRNGSA